MQSKILSCCTCLHLSNICICSCYRVERGFLALYLILTLILTLALQGVLILTRSCCSDLSLAAIRSSTRRSVLLSRRSVVLAGAFVRRPVRALALRRAVLRDMAPAAQLHGEQLLRRSAQVLAPAALHGAFWRHT